MKKRLTPHVPTLIVLLCIFAYTFSQAQNFSTSGWKLERDKEGIKVYTAQSPSSNVKDSRSEMELAADPETILRILWDGDKHYTWMNMCEESEAVEKVSETEYVSYVLADAPWPVTDRDVYTRWHLSREPSGKIIVTSMAEPAYAPEKEGIIRAVESWTRWEIIPQENRSVKVIYYNHAAAGGSIPDWLANMAATDVPLKTFRNLREKVLGE